IAELAFGAPSRQHARFERRHTRGIVAAVLKALERVDQLPRNRLTAENSNDAAQGYLSPSPRRVANIMYAPQPVSGKSKSMSGCDITPAGARQKQNTAKPGV